MRRVGHLAHPVSRRDVEQASVDPAQAFGAHFASLGGQAAGVNNDLAAFAQHFAVNQIDTPRAQVRLNDVAGLQVQNSAAAVGFGRDVADRRAVTDSGVAPVGQDHRQLLQMAVGVDVLHGREHFGHSVSFGPLAADDDG